MPTPTPADWLRIMALSLIWGAAFVNIRNALTAFQPLTIAALRIAIGAVALLLLARAMGQSLPRLSDRRRWAHVAGMAVFSNAVPFSLLGWAQRHVASGFAGLTMAAVPLFTLLIAVRFVPGERLTTMRVVGLLLGAAGVVLLVGPRALATSGAGAEGLARLACIGSALSYAIGSVITRRAPPMPLIATSAANLTLAAAVMLPLALVIEGWPAMPSASAALSVAYLGLMPTALATVLLIAVVASAGPTFLSLSNYQAPVWALLLGWLLYGEQLPASFLAALALILAGITVSSLRRR